MKILELFAGTRSVGKAAESLGWEVFSSDINNFEGIHYPVNILDFDYDKVPFVPDVIWASPPCERWSICTAIQGGSVYWEFEKDSKGKTIKLHPRTDFSQQNVRHAIFKNPDRVKAERELHCSIIDKTLEIIEHYKPKYWFIENPKGFLQYYLKDKVPIINCVDYCMYGFTYKKPTQIFSNVELELLKCDRSHKHIAFKDNKIKDYYIRSKIPDELCKSILSQCL